MTLTQNTAIPWADIIVAGILLISMWSGVRYGFLRTVFDIVKMVLAIILSVFLTPVVAVYLPKTVVMPEIVSYLISYVLIRMVFGIVSRMLKIVEHIPVIRQINKLLGGIAGLIRGLLFVWVLLFAIVMLTEVPECVALAKDIKNSPFLSQLYAWNPIPLVLRFFWKLF